MKKYGIFSAGENKPRTTVKGQAMKRQDGPV
jgi:hypothetical protein